jgi:nicotinate-nucleotide adenylyltransferase
MSAIALIMRQLAILGGTFDPVHWGHLLIAQTALSQLNLTQIIWVPDCLSPHKQPCSYEHRRSMVEQAITDNPNFILSPLETVHTKPNDALKTLTELQDTYSDSQWYWIIGIDAFQTLPHWYRREAVIPTCNWLVAPRPITTTRVHSNKSQRTQPLPDSQSSLLCQQVAQQLASQDIQIRWQLLQMPAVGISSTLIRQYCRQRRSIRYLVPEAVRAYIANHNLYLEQG